MIELRNLSKNYHAGEELVAAVNDVSLSVEKGEFMSVMGHSGSGKSTLLSLIGGLTRPDSGKVLIDGTDLWSINDNALSALRNKKINFIFQFSSLIPTLTVFENVILPSAFGECCVGYQEYATKLLEMVGLEDKLNAYPSQLSGGQQRRAAIARAFINQPQIILADEPTGDLDEETEAEIMNLFKRMNTEEGITFLIVTHSSEIANECRKKYRMSHGVLKRE